MKLVYISSDIGIHIEAISDALFQKLGNDFVFISTIKTNLTNGIHKYAEMGRDYSYKPYRLCAWESQEKEKEALQLIENADVVIGGGFPFRYIINRLQQKKLTFYSSERWFKRPFPLLSPKRWNTLFNEIIKYQNNRFRYLALGAYCANDARLLRVFKDKIYQFAYLVPIEQYDINEIIDRKFIRKTKIMWCARFLDWKHPELVVKLAKLLHDNNYRDFEITMVGGANAFQTKIVDKIRDLKLNDYFCFIEGLPNSEIRRMMKDSDIYLITSDRKEGWGAVLNEAMGAGCAIVASNIVGSVPVLLKHGQNGLIFKSESAKSLYKNVCHIIQDKELGKRLAYNAYNTINKEWDAANVAERLIALSQSILEGNEIVYESGPCSLARPCNKKVYD